MSRSAELSSLLDLLLVLASQQCERREEKGEMGEEKGEGERREGRRERRWRRGWTREEEGMEERIGERRGEERMEVDVAHLHSGSWILSGCHYFKDSADGTRKLLNPPTVSNGQVMAYLWNALREEHHRDYHLYYYCQYDHYWCYYC